MDVMVDRGEIVDVLKVLGRVAAGVSDGDGVITLAVNGSRLGMSGYNGESGYVSSVPLAESPQALIGAPTEVSVYAKEFGHFIRGVAAKQLRLVVVPAKLKKEAMLGVECGSFKATVPIVTQPLTPIPPHALTTPAYVMQAGDLLAVVEQVSHAVKADDTQYGLNGAHVTSADGVFSMSATDGHRAARGSCPANGREGEPKDVLVSRDALKMMKAALSKCEPTARVSLLVTREGLWLETALDDGVSDTLWARTIDGEFPNLDAVIQAAGTHRRGIRVRMADMDGILRRAETIAGSDGTLRLACRRCVGNAMGFEYLFDLHNPNVGSFAEGFPAVAIGQHGEDVFQIGFSVRYLREAVRALSGDVVDIQSEHDLGPVRINIEGVTDSFQIVMPKGLD